MLWYTSSFEDVVVYSVEYRIHIFDRNSCIRDCFSGCHLSQFVIGLLIPSAFKRCYRCAYNSNFFRHIFLTSYGFIYMRTAALDSVCGLYVRQFYDPMKIPLGSNSLSSVTSSLVGGSAFFKFGFTSSSQPTFSLISATPSSISCFSFDGIYA